MIDETRDNKAVIAVVVPSYKVKRHILEVLAAIGPEIARIYVVDDACPEGSGDHVRAHCTDPRVTVVALPENRGVGGATLAGFAAAAAAGATVIVKLDGDGQMDPGLVPRIVRPILEGRADYAKGNRFHEIDELTVMPKVRLFGNAGLSFMTKLSSGYWDIFDPTNGFVAIDARVFRALPVDKIARRYFFESDMLFRLNTLRAVVADVPIAAKYGEEVSNLSVHREFWRFLSGNIRNFLKRIFYNYLLRDFSLGTLYLVFGTLLLGFGVAFGAIQWIAHANAGETASAGTVMLAGLPVILGFQLVLGFLSYDIQAVPRAPLTRNLGD